MIRGNTQEFKFKIKKNDAYIDGSIYDEVEVQFNKQGSFSGIKKLKTKNEVVWIEDHFVCHLSQEDTFKLSSNSTQLQVRLKKNDIVMGTIIVDINVKEVLSNEVL